MTTPDEDEVSELLMSGHVSLEGLREIVTSYPRLRPLVAAYPGTDRALLDWLAGLGDPVVNQALAARSQLESTAAPSQPPLWSAPLPPAARPRTPARRSRVIGIGAIVLAVVVTGVFLVPRLMTRAPTLAAGAGHQCVMFDDGRVSCWGDPPTFGHNEENGKTTPRPITQLNDAVSIAASGETCAVHADGTVSCWGPRLSDISTGGTRTQLTPVPVQGITGAVEIAIGVAHLCFVKDDGSVSCWGDNEYGQVGNGSATRDSAMDSTAATPVAGVTEVTALTAGASHTCALSKDGTVKCWGYNLHGQLGNGTNTNKDTAKPITNAPVVSAVSAGAFHTCALLKDRTVRCWGNNDAGQLGNDMPDSSTTAMPVAGLSDVRAIAAGGRHTCAIQKDRTVACWGDNQAGQLGDGTTNQSSIPVQVTDLTGVVNIAAGSMHTCATRKNHAVVCWGNNSTGQLGIGSNTSSPVPEEVHSLS